MKNHTHKWYISFGPVWVCSVCGDIKKITKKEYEKLNDPNYKP